MSTSLCVLPGLATVPSIDGATLSRFYTLLTYPRFYPLRPACLCDGFTHALFRLPLHLGYDWRLCLAQLTPAYGVTSMPFHQGCHRPSRRSASLCSLLLLSQDCVLSLFVSVSFASAIHDIMLQHVLTSTVVTLRPFALFLSSWRILLWGRVWDSNPRCPTLLCNHPWSLIPSPSTTQPTRLTRFTFLS